MASILKSESGRGVRRHSPILAGGSIPGYGLASLGLRGSKLLSNPNPPEWIIISWCLQLLLVSVVCYLQGAPLHRDLPLTSTLIVVSSVLAHLLKLFLRSAHHRQNAHGWGFLQQTISTPSNYTGCLDARIFAPYLLWAFVVRQSANRLRGAAARARITRVPGLCYLKLFPVVRWREVYHSLGYYPTATAVRRQQPCTTRQLIYGITGKNICHVSLLEVGI